MIRILIADDHELVLDGIQAILEKEENLEIVGFEKDGEGVLEKVRTTEIDLLILDIKMPKMNGLDVMALLRDRYPELKVLILTMHNNPLYIKRIMELGADGFILKNTGKVELLTAIEMIMSGQTYFGQEVTRTLAKSFNRQNINDVQLTRREKEVLDLLKIGLSSDDISARLYVSTHTVHSHRKHLLDKFGVNNTVSLLNEAERRGFFDGLE